MTRLKGYRAKSAREFANIIAPRSYRAALTMHTERDVKWWISRHQDYWPPKVANFMTDDPSQWRDKGFSEKKQKELIASMFQEWPQYYWEFLVENGCLQIPKPLFASRLKEVMRRLSPLPPASHLVFWLGGRYNKNYSNAIKLLQQKLGLEPTGLYDMGTAWAVARKIGPWTPARMGYFLHEIIPDTIFEDYDETYIYGIDRDLWRKLGMKDEYLVNDQAEYWQMPSVSKWADLGFSFTGTLYEERSKDLKEKSKRKPVNKEFMESYGQLGKVLKRLGTIFQFAEPIEESLAVEEFDLGKIVKEITLTGTEIAIAAPLATGVIAKMDVTFDFADGTSWFHTFLNSGMKFGTELSIFEGVHRTIEYVCTKEFWDRVSAYLQEEHRKDIEEGFRLD